MQISPLAQEKAILYLRETEILVLDLHYVVSTNTIYNQEGDVVPIADLNFPSGLATFNFCTVLLHHPQDFKTMYCHYQRDSKFGFNCLME